MAEALWVQASGVEYSATEDRKLISSIWPNGGTTGGVIEPTSFTLSAGGGLSVNIGAGRALVADGSSGAYLCYFTSTTNLTFAANGGGSTRTDNIYVMVNTADGLATLIYQPASSPAPANSLLIGTYQITPAGSAPTNINTNGRIMASISGGGNYLSKSGADTAAGPITVTNGIVTGNLDLNGSGDVSGGLRVHGGLYNDTNLVVNGNIQAAAGAGISGGVGTFPGGIDVNAQTPTKLVGTRIYATTAGNVFTTGDAAGLWKSASLAGVYEAHNHYNNGIQPSNGRIIAPVAGYYIVHATVYINSASGSAGGACAVGIGVGASATAAMSTYVVQEGKLNSAGNCNLNASALVRVAAGGSIGMQWWRGGTIAATIPANAGGNPVQLAAFLLRAD